MKMLLAFTVFFIGINSSAEVFLFSSGSIKAETSWEKGPVKNEESLLKIVWMKTSDDSIIEPGEFDVVLWMPSMGHGSDPTEINKQQDGSYLISNMQFIMGGKWDVRIILKSQNGSNETQILPVELNGGHSHH